MKIIYTTDGRHPSNFTDIFTVKEEVKEICDGICRFRPTKRHGLATRRPRMFYPSSVRAKVYLYKVQEIYADRAMYKE